jgi:hypothetical protein
MRVLNKFFSDSQHKKYKLFGPQVNSFAPPRRPKLLKISYVVTPCVSAGIILWFIVPGIITYGRVTAPRSN